MSAIDWKPTDRDGTRISGYRLTQVAASPMPRDRLVVTHLEGGSWVFQIALDLQDSCDTEEEAKAKAQATYDALNAWWESGARP